MLRVELDPNGSFNVTEFGTVKDPALFNAIEEAAEKCFEGGLG